VTSVAVIGLDDATSMIRALGVGLVRDIGLLDSALAQPRTNVFGEDAYPTLAMKAAALLHSFAQNHPLADGIKRLAWLCTVVSSDLNGVEPDLTHDEDFDSVWDVASTPMSLTQIAHRRRTLPSAHAVGQTFSLSPSSVPWRAPSHTIRSRPSWCLERAHRVEELRPFT
jgi:death-on-curing protein